MSAVNIDFYMLQCQQSQHNYIHSLRFPELGSWSQQLAITAGWWTPLGQLHLVTINSFEFCLWLKIYGIYYIAIFCKSQIIEQWQHLVGIFSSYIALWALLDRVSLVSSQYRHFIILRIIIHNFCFVLQGRVILEELSLSISLSGWPIFHILLKTCCIVAFLA